MSSQPKNIIIIGPAYPLKGGIANFNEVLCRSLNEEGHQCEIISFSMQYPSFLYPGSTQFAENETAPDDIKITTLINSIQPFSWLKAASKIRALKPDYIIIRFWIPLIGPCLGSIARLVKRGTSGIKVIAIADNIIPHEKRPFDKPLTNWFINSCDAFLVMSKSVRNDLLAFDKTKPVVLQPHPVYNIFGAIATREQSVKELKLDPSCDYLLFFGLIRKYKGLDLLIDAFAKASQTNPRLRLLIAGEFYDDREAYVNQIRQAGIEDKVVIHGHYIPKEQVRFYFGASSLVVQPYRDATQSGVTQIAYHFGVPMIVTNVGGLPEIVPNGIAGYVTDVDSGSIASAITDFFQNKREDSLRQGVAQTAKTFSWTAMVKALDDLYRSLGKK
ncbi:MAG: glycosyltransferase [Bacteroidetes bacterium]|nr:glycosyltransferase [Bacteroidota bacterium]